MNSDLDMLNPPATPDKKKTWVRADDDIWERTATGIYYERPLLNGRRTYRSLNTDDLTKAKAEKKQRDIDRATKRELGQNTIGAIIHRYAADGYPQVDGTQRSETEKAKQKANCNRLLGFWEHIPVDELSVPLCHLYAQHRKKAIQRKLRD